MAVLNVSDGCTSVSIHELWLDFTAQVSHPSPSLLLRGLYDKQLLGRFSLSYDLRSRTVFFVYWQASLHGLYKYLVDT